MELLVAIVVIAIISTLLFFGVEKAIFATHRTQNASNLRQIGVANLAYASDNDGYLPTVTTSGGTRFHGWPPLVKGGYAIPEIFTSPLADLETREAYWVMNRNGDINLNNRFQEGGSLYPMSFESWEYSSYGDLTTAWGTRGHEQKLNGTVPLGEARQKMAWNFEFDIPYRLGFGHVLYMDGHVTATPTSTYDEWLVFMRSCK